MSLRRSSLACAIIATACASPTPPVASQPPAPAASEPTPPAAQAAPRLYALVVSFFSPGDGTDHEAAGRLDTLVAATHPSPARTRSDWGKEGEHDECFDLTELDPPARAAFIAAVRRDVAGPSRRVEVKTSAPCQSR